jgi:uncharacterized repeat protein (TIGR02543 family)
MTGLDFTTAWTAKATDSKWYFPQLTAFAGSSDNAVKALSLGSVTLTPFTVTFNSNSGSTVASEYGYYTAVSKPADPTKANSVFQGWYDNPGFSGSPWDFSTIISADRTLYAKWADLSHTVTFQSNFTLKTPSLTVKATDHRTVELSWKAVRGADGYYVFKKIGSAYQKIATVKGATIYADTGLSANVKYYYKVQAFRVPYLDEVTSKASSAKYARPVWPDVRITNIRAADYDSITLAWKGTAEAAGYQVLRSTSKKSGYTAIGTCAANTYTDDTAQAGVTYYYEVKAYDAYGAYSTASAYKSARTVPGTPQTLSLSSSAPGSVTVAWDSAGGSTGYGVYRATSPYGKYELVKAVTGTSYTDTGLAAGKTYYYKVRAYAQPAKAKVYGQYSEIKGLTI